MPSRTLIFSLLLHTHLYMSMQVTADRPATPESQELLGCPVPRVKMAKMAPPAQQALQVCSSRTSLDMHMHACTAGGALRVICMTPNASKTMERVYLSYLLLQVVQGLRARLEPPALLAWPVLRESRVAAARQAAQARRERRE